MFFFLAETDNCPAQFLMHSFYLPAFASLYAFLGHPFICYTII